MEYSQIRKIMKSTGLTVTAFCELIGIKKSTLYSYKNQRKPAESTIKLMLLIKDNPIDIVDKLKRLTRRERG